MRGRGRGKYICGECGIRCKKPSMLKKHIRTHTDVRPYICKHCNFAFKTKGKKNKAVEPLLLMRSRGSLSLSQIRSFSNCFLIQQTSDVLTNIGHTLDGFEHSCGCSYATKVLVESVGRIPESVGLIWHLPTLLEALRSLNLSQEIFFLLLLSKYHSSGIFILPFSTSRQPAHLLFSTLLHKLSCCTHS